MNNHKAPRVRGKIGVFDSGFGGLTVLAELLKQLPEYSYVYLGDNARAPYGPRPQEEIFRFTREAVDYLLGEGGCELVVLACNTASAEALRRIQQEYLPENYPHKRVLGVIIPTVEKLAENGDSGTIGVIATKGTVLSGAYIKELQKIMPLCQVCQCAAPELVPAIEAGLTGSRIEDLIRGYTDYLCGRDIKSLILGCTHYAIAEDEFRRVLPSNIKLYNQSAIIAEKLGDFLGRHEDLERRLTKGGGVKYLCTSKPKTFAKLANHLLGMSIEAIKISLAKEEVKCS